MKILYLTLEDLSLHKGSVVHIQNVVSGLRKRGHRVGLIGRASTGRQGVDFCNIHHMGFSIQFIGFQILSYLLSSVLLFVQLLKVLPQYDVIYARDYHTVLIAHLPRMIFKKRLIFEINGLANEEQQLKGNSPLRRLLSFLVRRSEGAAARRADRIVSVTVQIADYLTHHFLCESDKIKVIHNGVDTKAFYPVQDSGVLAEMREDLGIGEKETVIVFVGNMAPWQGLEYLIQLAPDLAQELKDFKIMLVGDGVLRKSIEAEINAKSGFIFSFSLSANR